MKASSLREQSTEELQLLLSDTRKELRDVSVRRSVGEASEQPLKIRSLRRDVARLLTILKEREATSNG